MRRSLRGLLSGGRPQTYSEIVQHALLPTADLQQLPVLLDAPFVVNAWQRCEEPVRISSEFSSCEV